MIIILLIFSLVGCAKTVSTNVDEKADMEQEVYADNTNEAQLQAPKEDVEDDLTPQETVSERVIDEFKAEMMETYGASIPTEWGERVTGVINSIDTQEKVIALTFDACGGGSLGNGFDEPLIRFLIEYDVPATLFISGNWIDNNMDTFTELARIPSFSIQNHGHQHKPLSIQGESAYGIPGTGSVVEAIDEIYRNHIKITEVTGKKPLYFRSGTAYYDDVAVKIANEFGNVVVNYSVVGDGGATFSQQKVENALLNAKSGSIVLLHMNRPDKNIAQGVMAAVIQMREEGFSFVTLDEYHDKLSPEVIQ